MICTGTGSAPMRAMTERRRRRIALKEGGELMLFFGARAPEELPYFGPLRSCRASSSTSTSRSRACPGRPKQYVQDVIRERGRDVVRLLQDEQCFVYVCGLKGMEEGVTEAFRDICRHQQLDWDVLLPAMRDRGRYHLETY